MTGCLVMKIVKIKIGTDKGLICINSKLILKTLQIENFLNIQRTQKSIEHGENVIDVTIATTVAMLLSRGSLDIFIAPSLDN